MNDVCIVTFYYPGAEKKISSFYKSLKTQTYKKFDLIIFVNSKINLYFKTSIFETKIYKMNKSIIRSRFEMIKILKKLKYKYMIFQDIDDTIQSNRIAVCKKYLKKNDIVINDLNINNKNKIIKNYFSKRLKNNSLITFENIFDYNFIGMSNSSIKKKCFDTINIPINNNIHIFDWYFWSVLLTKFKGYFTNETSTNYFVNPKSPTCLPAIINKKNNNKINIIRKSHKKALKKIINLKKMININNQNTSKNIKFYKYNFWWEKFS